MMAARWEELADRLIRHDAEWSVSVRTIEDGPSIFEFEPDRQLRSASTAKLLVLLATARAIVDGRLAPDLRIDRRTIEPVSDSGVWWHLAQPDLAVIDLARLTAMASDNLATNALITALGGVGAVARAADEFGVSGVHLHDFVRDQRTAEHAETLSTGSARGYVELQLRLRRSASTGDDATARVVEWLRDGLDLSMVASAYNLDPLSHHDPDRGLTVVNKTGSDAGVRVDSGVVSNGAASIAYTALANWTERSVVDPVRDDVMALMRSIGSSIRQELEELPANLRPEVVRA